MAVRTTALACILSAASIPSGSAAAAPQSWYIFPSVANTSGQHGAYYRTRVSLLNTNSASITVHAGLMTPDGRLANRTLTLSARSFRYWDDFVGTVFAYSGGGGLSIWEDSGTKTFLATAEVWTDGQGGRYTTPVTPMASGDRLTPPTDTGINVVQGLKADDAQRVNIGCMNHDTVAAQVEADVFGWSANSPSTEVDYLLELPPGTWKQYSVSPRGDWLSVNFYLLSGGGSVGTYCYAVSVNNTSNDGTAYPALLVR